MQIFREDALALLKREVVRIGTNGTRQGIKFAERMFAALPELRNASSRSRCSMVAQSNSTMVKVWGDGRNVTSVPRRSDSPTGNSRY